MKGHRKLQLTNEMKKRQNTWYVLFLRVLFLKWGKFLKVLKILLTFFLKENRIIVYISNKVTFGAFQISDTFFWVFVAPCSFVVWVGCLFVWVFSPSLSLCCIILIFHSSSYISSWAGKLVLPVDIISHFLKCWTQTLFYMVLLGFFMGAGYCKEHEAMVEVGTLLFACQNENWEHPTPVQTKMDWKIFYSCPFVLSFCLFFIITLVMFFLIVFLDQQSK